MVIGWNVVRSYASRIFGIASAALMLTAATARADDVADFYRGKTVQFYSGFPPGGGYYVYGQLLSQFLGRHIPGQPTVLIEAMPGASSLRLVQYLLNVAPKDGLSLGMFNRGLMTQAKMKPQEINVDFTKLAWVGSMASDTSICTLWGAKGISTLDQLRKTHVVIGDTSKDSGGYIYASILHSLAPDNTRTVLGYATSGDVWLAMENGEVDGNCNVWSSMKVQRPQWFSEHKANIVVQFTKARDPALPNVQTVFELATTDDQKKALDFLISSDAISRPVVAPPGVPADRLAALRDAFTATMKDPDFIATAAKLKVDLAPVDWKVASDIAASISHAPQDVVDLGKKMIDVQ